MKKPTNLQELYDVIVFERDTYTGASDEESTHRTESLNNIIEILKNELEQHYEILNDNYNLAFEFFADYFNANKEVNIILNKELAFEEYTKWLTTKDEEDYENEL